MPKSPKEMEAAIIKNLPEKTGKSLEQWIEVLRKDGPEGKKDRLNWLKQAHGLGHFQANTIIKRAESSVSEYDDEKALLANLFKGTNAHTRPWFNLLQEKVATLGEDIEVKISKSYISFYRKKQFLITKPLKDDLMLGLALPKDTEHQRLDPAKRLGGSERITFQIQIQSERDIDDEVLGIIKTAYDLN